VPPSAIRLGRGGQVNVKVRFSVTVSGEQLRHGPCVIDAAGERFARGSYQFQ